MSSFYYHAPLTLEEALRTAALRGAAFVAGGTSLVDLMKLRVAQPEHLIDINALPLKGVMLGRDSLKIGALERMSDVAAQTTVRDEFPVLVEALLAGASPQLRNVATIVGNLLQPTRCPYFRDPWEPCNRRTPGSGCAASFRGEGDHRRHAIFGGGTQCIATHPSDLAVALVALGAWLNICGGNGERTVALEDFFLLPGDTPERTHALAPAEIVVSVEVPRTPCARRSTYVKVRDRASFDFALVSVAVALDLDSRRRGLIREARVVAGGVGTTPWRLLAVEEQLRDKEPSLANFEAAAELSSMGAEPLPGNSFKVGLLEQTVTRALLQATRT